MSLLFKLYWGQNSCFKRTKVIWPWKTFHIHVGTISELLTLLCTLAFRHFASILVKQFVNMPNIRKLVNFLQLYIYINVLDPFHIFWLDMKRHSSVSLPFCWMLAVLRLCIMLSEKDFYDLMWYTFYSYYEENKQYLFENISQ